MRILLTRPRAQAESLARALRDRGHEVLVEPMLEIAPVEGAVPDLEGVVALLFTSANGVAAFARACGARDLPAFAVGEATAAAARAAGFRRVASAAGNAQTLARLVASRLDPAAGALLYVSGREVRGDLEGRLAARGFETRRIVLYAATPAPALTAGLKKALARGAVDVVLFLSPRTAATFAARVREARLAESLAGAIALCLSEAVAERVRGLLWKRVAVAERPDAEAILSLVDGVAGLRGRSRSAGAKAGERARKG